MPRARYLRRIALATLCIALIIITRVSNSPGSIWNYVLHVRNIRQAASISEPRLNATFVVLARNSDIWEIASSIRNVEERFNHRFHYDWVFLNEEAFDDMFKNVVTKAVSGRARFSRISPEHWSFPSFIDQDKAAKVREEMSANGVVYGDSISYRHMCRFESGFFFLQQPMLEYDWYWRVEPGIELYCDINYDVFRLMADEGKKYGFVISLHEYVNTIPTLWKSVKHFIKEFPHHVAMNNSMVFLSDDGGQTYNYCHFWSNFEIGSLNWLRSRAYSDYFKHIDRAGGFYYERWGDAPVHSIAAGLLLHREEIHYFRDIAYYHAPFTHCPSDEESRKDRNCNCAVDLNFVETGDSCLRRFEQLHS